MRRLLMGIYLNPGNSEFKEAINSQIYVDKTGLIAYANSVISTSQKYMCVSRPRRFGKSIAAHMLAAYYDRESDSAQIFAPYEIAQDESFDRHLGMYDVVAVDMQRFLSVSGSMDEMISKFRTSLTAELKAKYEVPSTELEDVMVEIHSRYEKTFIIIIDEWDSIFRVHKDDKDSQTMYLDFLRLWLKDRSYIALAYMTGILPIKKYGYHSALNMFTEYSMTLQGPLAGYTGFTQPEVEEICDRYDMDIQSMERWYNGYLISGLDGNIAVYSPRSVVQAVLMRRYKGFWTRTETYEALKIYIDMNYDGLRDAIIGLLAGDHIRIDTSSYSNDMVTFSGYEDILTLLVHLGYLGYDIDTEKVFIPNKEITKEFVTAMKGNYSEVIKSVRASETLLQATWSLDAEAVSEAIESAHQETAHITYNSETALSYTISLAYYAAREYYQITREYPAGKGFADLVFIPRPNHQDKPAMVVELKWDESAKTAISQIKEKHYPDALKDYDGHILLVGISYDKNTKNHEAIIEQA
jgi:hypothetical protein